MLFLYFFSSVIFINCVYFLIFLGLAFSKSRKPKLEEKQLPISVLVYIKNNAKQLNSSLKAILEQDYPDFELVLINDYSSDNSLELLEAFKIEHPKLPIHICDVKENQNFYGCKKYALFLGIKNATYEHLLFTDANSKPSSKHWIQEMSKGFQKEKQLILGYSTYSKRKGLFNLLLRFDSLLNTINSLSFANARMTYMGVGRNLAFTHKAYDANYGFISHVRIPYGEDDLFINEVATKANTSLVWSKDAHIETEALQDMKAWSYQHKQRAHTFKYYKTRHKLILSGYFISRLLFWLCAIASFFLLSWQLATSLIGIRILIQYLCIGILAYKLNASKLILFIPWLEVPVLIIQLFTASFYIKRPIPKMH